MRVSRLLGIFLVLLYALAFQGSRALWERDEGRYTQVGLEMLSSGDWWTPHLYYPETTHFTKPPGTYWAIAAAVGVFGHSEWAVRLPNALAFAMSLLSLYCISLRLGYQEKRARWAALIYGTFLLPYLAANAVTTDTLLCAAETLAAWGFVGHYFKGEAHGKQKWIALMWLGFALAFLIKGPPGLLPLLAFAIFLVLRHGTRGLSRLFSLPGVLIFLVLGLGWFISQIIMRPELLSYFLGEETIGRIATDAKGRNGDWLGPFRIYLPTLIVGPFPWIFLLGLPAVGKLRKLFDRVSWSRWKDEDPALFFLLLWFLIPLLVFVLSRSRLPLYLLPLFVPLALLLARLELPGFLGKRPRLASVCLLLWIPALVGFRFAASRVENVNDASRFAAVIRAQQPQPLDEVVFVSARAWYGLGFYLNCRVESVSINQEELGYWHDQRETLRDEIEGDSKTRLYIVMAHRSHDFEENVRGLGFRTIQIAEWGKLRVYRVFPDDDQRGELSAEPAGVGT